MSPEQAAPRASVTYRRLLGYVKPYQRKFALAILCMVFFALTDIAFAWLMKPLLDGSFVEKDELAILLVPIAIIGIFIVRGIAGFGSTYLMAWIGWQVIKNLRADVFQKYLTLPARYYDTATSGDLVSKITFNSQAVASAASSSLTVMVRDTLTSIGLLGLMFYQSWQLSLCFLVIGPIIGFLVARVSKKFRAISRNIQGSMGEVTNVIQEALDGNRVIKIFDGVRHEVAQFETANEDNRQYNMREALVRASNVPVVQFLVAIALAIIVYLASSGLLIEEISVGRFMSFIAAMLMLFSPMRRLTTLNSSLQRGIAAGESLFAVLDLESERDKGKHVLQGDIEGVSYQNVSLNYQVDKPNVLRNVSLDIQSGQTIAFVGESGSGKTSMVNLLPRLYEISAGQISINGRSIDDYTLQSLRNSIAYVSQDVTLFNDTIANNIAYGGLNSASSEQIVAAAKAAHADDFIQEMPEKYDTMVGENGVLLSGGQRQRLAIARAFLKNAPILVLDEATSALDTDSERKVQEGLDSLLQSARTTLVVAHRLSTIERADLIVVLQDGEIVERGSHSELLALGAHYARLHKLQGGA